MSGLPNWVPGFYQRFWRGPDVSAVQLARFRWVFFALIAIDGFMLVSHAPRYGAGGFNISHLGPLDALVPTPTRVAIIIAGLLICFLGARMVLGRASRVVAPLLCVVYGAVYFSSQLDSFQHHYLLSLMLLTACFIDWDTADTDDDNASGWAIRLLLLQVSVVYLFAAISKMEAGWWDGRALALMIEGGDSAFAKDVIGAIGAAPAAKLVVLTELFLAVAIHVRLLRVPAVLVGVGLHAGIELSGFEIELFSYYMIGLYLLVLPPAAFRWASIGASRWQALGRALGRGPIAAWAIAAVAGSAVVIGSQPLDGAWLAGALVAALGVIGILQSDRRRRASAAHLVAALAVLACALTTDAIRDHYRFWGGSSRRLGDLETATRAYQRLVDIEPSYAAGRRNLGDLYRRTRRFDEALDQYLAATRLEPDTVSGHLGLARVYGQLARPADAVAAAVRARELAEAQADDPRMRRAADEARRIEAFWRKKL